MGTRQILTNRDPSPCAVCQRNLLRGEHHDLFIHGGQRRIVCELCTGRATAQGWIRESADLAPASGRIGWIKRSQARSLGGRRGKREEQPASELLVPPEAEALVGDESAGERYEPPLEPPVSELETSEFALPPKHEVSVDERAVRAVPTHADRKGARAIEIFNAGEHPRTIATLARTLGAPIVSVRPSVSEGSIVSVVIGWDLSWYSYEVDLADEGSGARLIDKGSELSELDERDLIPNAIADSSGTLHTAVDAQ